MEQERPVAVVTGAGSGIGAAVTLRLVARGFDVVAVGRSREPLEGVAAAAPAGRVHVRPADVSDTTAVVELVAETVEVHGRLDVVVNNAGDAVQLPIADTTPERFAAAVGVNLVGPAAMIHAAWPTFVAQGRGCVVNVSSLAQFDPFPGFFAYAPAKAGLHLLTVVAAAEGAEHGIRAFTVAPGVVESALHRRLMPDGVEAQYRNEPDEVAALIEECIIGERDDRNGWTLAAVTPAVAVGVHEWIASHPGGGIEVVPLGPDATGVDATGVDATGVMA